MTRRTVEDAGPYGFSRCLFLREALFGTSWAPSPTNPLRHLRCHLSHSERLVFKAPTFGELLRSR